MAKNVSYLGIDVGGSSLKIVELVNVNNKPQLVTYGFINDIPNMINDNSLSAKAEVASHLKHLLKESNTTTTQAVAALPSFSVFSSIINLPSMSKKDLISAVRWEAKKFVPIPLEEMILDWEVLGEKDEKIDKINKNEPKEDNKNDNSNKKDDKGLKIAKKDEKLNKNNIKVLLTAAPKNLVNKYVELFKAVGLQLVGLETESFALERSLIGNDKNPIMVIDVGGSVTNIIIYSEGIPILNRSIDVGGNSLSKSLSEVMDLSFEQAEQYKKDLSFTSTDESLDSLPIPLSKVINSIINEVKYIINIYQNQNNGPISKIILSGGSSYIINLSRYVQDIFNIKTYIGDPWARVVHPVEIDKLLKQLGPRMAIPIGLAMREIS
ncbi:MAG: pilus assembly protein PilM [Candidatus Kerfeldbacteria bacterium]